RAPGRVALREEHRARPLQHGGEGLVAHPGAERLDVAHVEALALGLAEEADALVPPRHAHEPRRELFEAPARAIVREVHGPSISARAPTFSARPRSDLPPRAAPPPGPLRPRLRRHRRAPRGTSL